LEKKRVAEAMKELAGSFQLLRYEIVTMHASLLSHASHLNRSNSAIPPIRSPKWSKSAGLSFGWHFPTISLELDQSWGFLRKKL
jgi:hypothetical protein